MQFFSLQQKPTETMFTEIYNIFTRRRVHTYWVHTVQFQVWINEHTFHKCNRRNRQLQGGRLASAV